MFFCCSVELIVLKTFSMFSFVVFVFFSAVFLDRVNNRMYTAEKKQILIFM